MNRVIPVDGPPASSDQRIDRQLKGEGGHRENGAPIDNETRADRERIEPDQQAILALQRVSGAHVHRSNGLIHAYTSACYLGEVEMVEAVKRDMTAFAVRCIRESTAFGA